MPTSARRHTVGSVRDHIKHGRGTNKQRGYDSHWRRISLLKRDRNPLCEVCGKAAATAVDHIIPFTCPSDPQRTDWANLQSICAECHAVKTSQQRRRG